MPTAPQPTAKPKRRWFQFSLRTLLIGTAVIAALLGVSLRWIAPAQRQRAAVRLVESLRGNVSYWERAPGASGAPDVLREWLPVDYFDSLAQVDLSGTPATDAELIRLAGLAELVDLQLENTQVTDAGLAHLKQIKGLRSLSLRNTQVTDAGLVHLKELTSLQWLQLGYTHATEQGAADLKKVLPNCEIHWY